MPGGFDGGALGFLCFGWTTTPVAVAAARGMAYFFGGMACFFAASGRGFGGRKGENGGRKASERERCEGKASRNVGKRPSGRLQGGPTRLFRLCRLPKRPPRAPGLAWVRRHQFWPEPAKNGLLGARLGPFFGAGAAKSPGEGLLGARLEMPLRQGVDKSSVNRF